MKLFFGLYEQLTRNFFFLKFVSTKNPASDENFNEISFSGIS